MYAASLHKPRLTYETLQIFAIAHVWIGFLLCYLWLRSRRLTGLACILGAGVFAFSGYVCLQLQHLGLIAGYVWFPLGLMGIDQAFERRHWKPLLMLVAASALCFLAGYPPTWFVFAICMVTYAVAKSWRSPLVAGTVLSLGVSFLVTMVQFLPTWELSGLKMPESRYGSGITAPVFYLSYLLPNYFNFGRNVSIFTNFGKEYLYLGVPALFGIAYALVRGRRRRDLVPFLAVGAICLVVLTNPFNLVWDLIKHSSLLVEICRDWYFLAGITFAAAPLAAYGLNDFLKRKAPAVASWLAWVAFGLLGAWSSWEFARWLGDGSRFPSGWRSIYDPAIMLAIFTFTLYVVRGRRGTIRTVLAIGLVLAVGVDYKVFGTSKRFNTATNTDNMTYTPMGFPGMDPQVYQQLRAHAEYRILLDDTGPLPVEFRHVGLMTPQGYDPFITRQYVELIQSASKFRTERLFFIDPGREEMLRLLGVRYVISSESGPLSARLQSDPNFRRMGSTQYYYWVFEYRNARPPFGWEDESADRQVEPRELTPERREFAVRSSSGGQFTLDEQFLPGWQASIDGNSVPIERWKERFKPSRRFRANMSSSFASDRKA